MMDATTRQMTDSPGKTSDVQSPTMACIDLDRFCINCGYNLRTLPVCHDERTGIPIVQCTECGRFQSANDASTALRPWLDRLTLLLLGLWILLIIAVVFNLGMAEVAVSYANLEELTEHAGSTVQRIGNMTIRNRINTLAPLEVHTDFPEYELFVASMVFGSFMIAFACALFIVVTVPHWPRIAYVAIMVAMPIIAAIIVTIIWHNDAPHLLLWGLPYIAAHFGAQLIGGISGATFGRPLARGAVRVFLPPSVRPRLAYLWLADRQAFPRPSADERR
jgi:hypothetical protein